ncbi:flagellar biosynthetic protein FliO [Sporosarcina sp. resist]|uniref:flagellar biosynthetic protein FliO n=1 Tax=Sporosarcina sp. resist TaxID=2762563 RepID=UPI00164ED427|nr:flagellar biosynthetic protein FliO [Sporosarcina sp. resist]QNK86937.1 flagellar biosynthetic protein FliO [Sporosarcina sp. resist]
MKSTNVQKYLSAFILIIFLVTQLPYASVHADTDVDPNKSVSDLFNKDSEKDADTDEDKLTPPADDLTTDNADVGSSAGDYIKTLFALVFVLGLLFGLLKFVNRKNKLYDKNRLMKNMGGISLGQHKSIQLVVIGESYYLIGVGDDIRLLKEITDPDEIDKLVEFYAGDNNTEIVSGMLNRILAKVTGKSKSDSNMKTEESSDFSTVFQTRLEEMKEERKPHISRLTEKERNRDE